MYSQANIIIPMKLPNFNKAIIPREKLTSYVLSETHSTGKFKAKFFGNLGFDETNVSIFEKSILKIAKSEEITDEISTPYGMKYVLDGKLETPSGKIVKVRTLWIIEQGQNRPRLITVCPV